MNSALAALRQITLAVSCAGCSVAMAAPSPSDFTFLPRAVGLNGDIVVADGMVVTDYSRTLLQPDGSFAERGLLAVQGFVLDGAAVASAGLNVDYGLYLEYAVDGVQTTQNPFTSANSGAMRTLAYTLHGYNGPAAAFGFDGQRNAVVRAPGSTVLAHGTLVSGTVATTPVPQAGGFAVAADADLSFHQVMQSMYPNPASIFPIASTSFRNPPSSVVLVSPGEFLINEGSGTIRFGDGMQVLASSAPLGTVPAVPEPGTWLLMLAGVLAIAVTVHGRTGG